MKFLFLFLFVFISTSYSQSTLYFYTGKNYGSESLFNPVSLVLNGSYDIIQLEGRNRKIFNHNYTTGFRNVFKNLSSPLSSINKFGWGKFISNEILPLTITKKGAQWWPNYQLHLIGGGMTYVAMTEWYQYHSFPAPEYLAATSIIAYHLLNEVVENDSHSGVNVDPIADIYFFDIGGMILFSFDNVKKFFSEELNLADWSLQPSFALDDYSLQNNGQYFSIKWKIPTQEKLFLFYYFGMNGLTGLSYKFSDEETISIGAGLRAKKLISIDQSNYHNTIDMVWNFGLFYDRNNSLITSLFISGLTDNFINLNIYPGVLKYKKFSPGLWGVVQKNGKFIFGITTVYLPGIGFR